MGDDPRVSDEATGLPPLDDLVEEETVRYLHARGIIRGGPSGVEWAQIHLAIPVEDLVAIAESLTRSYP